MRGFSKAIITGNLTRDPELRTTSNGKNVCSFAVAVNRVYRDANGDQKEEVSYIDCSAWGPLAETISKYARRGSGVLVSGRLHQSSWEDKASGSKRSRLEVVVEDFNFVGGGREDSGAPTNTSNRGDKSTKKTAKNADDVQDDYIPEDIPEGEIAIDEIPF